MSVQETAGTEVPQVILTRDGRQVLNVVDMFPLPAGEVYGNLLSKIAGIHERIFEANRQLVQAYQTWERARQGAVSNDVQRHLFAVEHVTFHLRRAADEMIGLRAVVSHYEQTGDWPRTVNPDSVGELLGREALCALPVYRDHIELLRLLNDLHNAQKHSFLNTDTTMIGRDEPTANAIHRRRNRAAAELEVYAVSLRALVEGFQAFALSALAELREISRSIQDRQAPTSGEGS